MGDYEVAVRNYQLSLEIIKFLNNNEGIVNKFDECKGDLEQVDGVCINLILQFGFGRSIACSNIPLDNCGS